ncbi:hypothetical protein [Kocuria sp.]|uniref:hypothetical protein n=1 Tax=Kocuria sp. TaxID=1871328 RepID=UPI0026DFF7DB|nr:hypothetical protein [Kocuria sp.]MDO5617736.1 hypothetical protein [Kocuria sp.]
MSDSAGHRASTAPGVRGSLWSARGVTTVWAPLLLITVILVLWALSAGVPVWVTGLVVVTAFALSGDPVVRFLLYVARDLEAQRRNTMALITGGPESPGRGGATEALAADPSAAAPEPMGPPLRGGLVIGILERACVAACLAMGFPNGVAIVVAIKGLARYGEFTTAFQREQFIIGTLASLLWAALGAGVFLLLRST